MPFNIKTKLSLGLGFLFAVIILIGSVGAVYIHKIANESKVILKDNYESIQYSKAMLQSLDDLENDTISFIRTFEKNLAAQEKNITEIGESDYTKALRNDFEKLKAGHFSKVGIQLIRERLYTITDINMEAILRKNNQAQKTADRVLTYIGIIGGICFLVVFTFIINFPGYIANPIKLLTESIKQIAGKNYHQRLNFKSDDEFGELALAFNAMAEKLEHYDNSSLAKIMFEKKRIETIINNIKDAIIGLSENRIILFANKQAVNLLNMQEQELIGQYAPDVAVSNDLMRLLISDNTDGKPVKIVSEGKENYFNKEAIAMISDEKPIGEVILLRNITQFQELDLAKTNFIATISHELKTPIASIKLSSALLEDNRVGGLNEEQKQLVKNIKEESDRLLKISGEVLNMAQVETGKIQLSFQKVNVEAIVNYAVDAVKLQATQKDIRIIQKIDEHLPPVYADPEKTAWVMVNLLSNAIRYSPEKDDVIIHVTKINRMIQFSVSDHGLGIEAQYQGKIFDKFFHIPGNPKHGTGLGLAIAREFITAQNGIISLKSNPETGTTFTFQLPAGA
ncbi:MAG: HAMP domain-containing protein [Bacteroidetes bacterium]|nr:HAMP domain-containing protein [Bacteroidota bacterium]